MPARDTSKADTDTSTDKADTGEATTSVSAADASTTEGRANALGVGQAGQPAATDPTRVVVEQAPAEPAVYYGEGGVQPATADRPHVKAKYEPFEW